MEKRKTADLVLLLVAFIWGATFVVVQNAISFLEPHSFNMVRFLIAGVILFTWMILFQRQQLKLFNKKIILSGVFLGFWLFIGYAFQTMGLLYTTSSKAGFITGLSVVLVPFISILLLKVKPALQAVIGVFAATLGLYLLTMTGSSELNIGDLLVLICAVGFAMQIILTGKYSSRFPTLLLTIIQISTVSLLSGLSAFLFEDWSQAFQMSVILQPEVIFALVITGVFATALAFLSQTYFQKFTSATHTALIFSMEPVFAALTAFVFVGERLGMTGIIGSFLIFSGMLLAELPVKKKGIKNDISEKDPATPS